MSDWRDMHMDEIVAASRARALRRLSTVKIDVLGEENPYIGALNKTVGNAESGRLLAIVSRVYGCSLECDAVLSLLESGARSGADYAPYNTVNDLMLAAMAARMLEQLKTTGTIDMKAATTIKRKE